MSQTTDHAHLRAAVDGGGLHLLNTTIIPAGQDGRWEVATISNDLAAHLFRYVCGFGLFPEVHIGHQATAEIAGELLGGCRIEPDRTPWKGDGLGLALQLKGRIPEGKILSRDDMDLIGYDWRVFYRLAEDGLPVDAYRPGAQTAVERQCLCNVIAAMGTELRFVRRGESRTRAHAFYTVHLGDQDITWKAVRVLADPLNRTGRDAEGGYSGSGQRGHQLMVWVGDKGESEALATCAQQIAVAMGLPAETFGWRVE